MAYPRYEEPGDIARGFVAAVVIFALGFLAGSLLELGLR